MAGKIDKQLNSTNQFISNDISEELTLVNPNVSPIMSHILRGGRKEKTNAITFEWVDHYERKTNSTLKKALATADVEIQVNDEDVLVKDALLAIGDEIVKITNVKTDNKADVTRGYAGTTKNTGTFEVGTAVQSLGIEMEEGGDLKPSTVKLPIHITNNTGIIFESYEITETAKHLAIHGQGGLSARELESQKKKDEMMGYLENKVLNGVKFSNGKQRNSGGAKSLIKAHGIVFDARNKDISVDLLDEVVKAIVDRGNPGAAELKAGKYFLCVPWAQAVKINRLNKESVRTDIRENVTGTLVTEVITNAGKLTVFPAPSLLDNEFLVTNLFNYKIKELYPIKEEMAAKTGLRDAYFFHGEHGLEIKNLPFQVHVKNVKVK